MEKTTKAISQICKKYREGVKRLLSLIPEETKIKKIIAKESNDGVMVMVAIEKEDNPVLFIHYENETEWWISLESKIITVSSDNLSDTTIRLRIAKALNPDTEKETD